MPTDDNTDERRDQQFGQEIRTLFALVSKPLAQWIDKAGLERGSGGGLGCRVVVRAYGSWKDRTGALTSEAVDKACQTAAVTDIGRCVGAVFRLEDGDVELCLPAEVPRNHRRVDPGSLTDVTGSALLEPTISEKLGGGA
ncbi:hypothetical protein GCM10009608_81330 [Pseudonocardia alaniniphila]|nr:hypothetical protein [Pseudonocardia alaniniphila]